MMKEDEKPATFLAKILLGQVDREKTQCAFWVVSAIHKIAEENPNMSMVCLRNIVSENMPAAFKEYRKYLRET